MNSKPGFWFAMKKTGSLQPSHIKHACDRCEKVLYKKCITLGLDTALVSRTYLLQYLCRNHIQGFDITLDMVYK